MLNRLLQLAISLSLLASFGNAAMGVESRRVLVVVGPSNHPPGSHEVAAGGRLLAHCLNHLGNVSGITASVVYQWPDEALRDSASTIVFIGDTFPPNRWPDPQSNLDQLAVMMQRGCGIVCVHYATGLRGEDVGEQGEHPLLEWLGGYFANRTCPHHESFARIFKAATIEPAAPMHPVSRGWQSFTVHDEPYINNYFGGSNNQLAANVTALATSLLPPDDPQPEVVAWGVERQDGGRGFGIVMPHFYKNWTNENLRRFILNGIVWSAQVEVPPSGVDSDRPALESFAPESVEFQPRKPNNR